MLKRQRSWTDAPDDILAAWSAAPHDILAAWSAAPHDILAAEEFGVPASDPELRGPAVLPDDPSGIDRPHDVLAAEEFPMPGRRRRSPRVLAPPPPRSPRLVAVEFGLLAVAGGAAVRRLLGHRPRGAAQGPEDSCCQVSDSSLRVPV